MDTHGWDWKKEENKWSNKKRWVIYSDRAVEQE